MNEKTPSTPLAKDHRALFLGREKELQWLQDAWRATREGGPQMRILTAESGYGKTKIAQAFYTWLSTECDPDHYWPDNLLHEGKNLRIMPDMTGINASSSMPWFWWGLRFSDSEGRNATDNRYPFFSARSHPDFSAHEEALKQVIYQAQARNSATLSLFRAGLALFPGADSVTHGLQALSDLWDNWKIARTHREQLLAMKLEEAQKKQIGQVLALFRLLLDETQGEAKSFPVVLLLDDAHWMDAISLDIVRLVWGISVEKNFPLLVLATNWRKEWNHGFDETASGGSLARWIWESTKPNPESQDQHPVQILSPRVQIFKLGKLPQVGDMLLAEFSGLDQKQVDFICEQASGNPRHIKEIILLLKRKPHWFKENDPAQPLNDSWQKNLTRDKLELHTLESERFDSIAVHLKNILGTASLQGDRFLQTFTLEVAKKLGFEPNHSSENVPDNPLKAAENPHALAEAIDELSMEFRSTNIRKCAEEYLEQCGDLDRVAAMVTQTAHEWINTKKINDLQLDSRLRLLDCASILTGNAGNRAGQILFHATALQSIRNSGYMFRASPWIDSWERLAPRADELSSCGFWMLLNTARLFRSVGKESLALSLVRDLEGHPESEGNSAIALGAKAAWAVEVGDLEVSLGKTEAALEHYLQSLVLDEQTLKQFGGSNELLSNISIALIKLADVELSLGQRESALERYLQSLALSEQVREQFGDTLESLRNTSVSLNKVADVERSLGQTESALKRYLQSLALFEQVREQFEDTPERLRNISISLSKVADVELALGETERAMERYLESLALFEQVCERFGDTPESLNDISFSIDKVADVERSLGQTESALKRYLQSLALFEQVREQFEDTPERLRDISVLLNKVADLEHSLGQTESALKRYHQSLALREKIVELFGDTPERLSDISISLDRVANVERSLGQTERALKLYLQSLALKMLIREQFGDTAERMRDISVWLNIVADLERSLGQTQSALDHCLQSAALFEQICKQFGESAERLRDISVSVDRAANLERSLGETESALKHYLQSLALRVQIRKQFGDTLERLSDISVLLDKVADLELFLGQTQTALKRLFESLELKEQIREQFGDNPERLRDISLLLSKVAVVEYSLGQKESAMERSLQGLALFEQIREQFGDTAERLRDMIISHYKLAQLFSSLERSFDAISHAQQALAIARKVLDDYGSLPQRSEDLEICENLLSAIKKNADAE
jgi:tetratricopeptide (TPR) repeat protein